MEINKKLLIKKNQTEGINFEIELEKLLIKYHIDFEKQYKLNISSSLGIRFDFVIDLNEKIYILEAKHITNIKRLHIAFCQTTKKMYQTMVLNDYKLRNTKAILIITKVKQNIIEKYQNTTIYKNALMLNSKIPILIFNINEFQKQYLLKYKPNYIKRTLYFLLKFTTISLCFLLIKKRLIFKIFTYVYKLFEKQLNIKNLNMFIKSINIKTFRNILTNIISYFRNSFINYIWKELDLLGKFLLTYQYFVNNIDYKKIELLIKEKIKIFFIQNIDVLIFTFIIVYFI